MGHRPPVLLFWVLLTLTAASGASCPQFLSSYPSSIPRVLPPNPTLAGVMRVLEENSARVHSLSTTDASVSAAMFPSLKASLALERPRRIRLRAETALSGPEVDVGSNDELLWFWVRRSQPPALYLCRHDQFQYSAARQVIPIEPGWIVEALGITRLDPALSHTEPMRLRGGRLQVRTQLPHPGGPQTKITVLDEARGWVLEQHLYNAQGQRLASAITSQHWRDPASGAVLPRRIEVQWPATNFTLNIHVHSWQVNRLPGEGGQLWQLPTYPGYEVVDLANPDVQPAQPAVLPPAIGGSQFPGSAARRPPAGPVLPPWQR